MILKLLPIDIDISLNERFSNTSECLPTLAVFPDFYKRVGFNKPWIGYFVSNQKNEIVGGGGFKGKPIAGKVEVSYGTFKAYEGAGVGTMICKQLVLFALQTESAIRITARTMPENKASMGVLKKSGFECFGPIYDEEDGEVLEWEYKNDIT